MKWYYFLILLVISCPRPAIRKVPEFDYLREARRNYQNNPLYAYSILKDSVKNSRYNDERAEMLVKIYIDQREYERAAELLDSINWSIALTPYENSIILLKTKRWEMLADKTSDDLLKGIAYYNLNEFHDAIEYLSKPEQPHDFRMIYLAKVYERLDDFESALKILITIDSVSAYLYPDFQDLLFVTLMNTEDFAAVQKELKKLKKTHLQEFVLLKIYEKQKDTKNLKKTAWKLVRTYPKSEGAYYAVQLLKPKTKSDHESFGKVYYYHNDYEKAIEHFGKSSSDNAVNYYIGRIYYNRKNYHKSLKYFSLSDWAAAYYYRGRIYENLNEFERAKAVYDSLFVLYRKSEYAVRGLKRKAFLLEDIGDTLNAVETFLKIGENSTKFRAAMQLYRIGNLKKAYDILEKFTASSFVYWQIRIKERLGEPTDSLKNYLLAKHPLSYYTLTKFGSEVVYDTTSLDLWLNPLADSTATFTSRDSLHLNKAIRYFHLNEMDYAAEELDLVESQNGMNLLYLSKLCAKYGADKQSILYSLRLRDIAEKNNMTTVTKELLRLLYPVRYTFSIREQQMDLSLCLAMIWQESLFDPEALSPAHAHGLMQIIPQTAKKIAHDLNVQSYSLDDPSVSIRFGCYYFVNVLNDFNSVPLSLAGYNAGPVRVKRWIKQNPNYEIDEFIDLIPYNETRNYVKSVLSREIIYREILRI